MPAERRERWVEKDGLLADSPDLGGSEGRPDVSERRAFLPQRAKRKRSARTFAWAADANTSRLLEDVASEANLALATLNVVCNEGALGIDGQTEVEAEADAPKLLPRLRRALLEGTTPNWSRSLRPSIERPLRSRIIDDNGIRWRWLF